VDFLLWFLNDLDVFPIFVTYFRSDLKLIQFFLFNFSIHWLLIFLSHLSDFVPFRLLQGSIK